MAVDPAGADPHPSVASAEREMRPASSPSPRSYTPRHLADKILKTRAAVEGERKQVTVLFADVKESMNLAESVDAETWHGILDGFFSILSSGVHRFEGTINQYTGDGIMALFGAPIAHEDHAHRACYAALLLSDELARYADELRRRHGLNFSVRMGVNSGEVIVGKIGDDLRMDYTAQGHTVGLAARVEQLAAPNKAYLTEHTATLVDGYFRLRDLGDFALKGVRDEMRVYELEGVGSARTRLDVSRSRGFSRFVGRDREMAKLDRALERVAAGESQVVSVVAEAGAGKSRLCYEFAQRCRAHGIDVLEAHCVAHGQMIPYLPVLELFRGYFGVSEQDGDQVVREKIAGRLLLLSESFKDTLPYMFDFLGVADRARPAPPLEPQVWRKLLSGGVRKILECSEEQKPAVILFEDLHWIDGASDGFLSDMIGMLDATRELVLVNTRPGYEAAWMDAPWHTSIRLEPLGEEAIAALLRDLLGNDTSVRGLADRIGRDTAGNPFFVEEVVRELIESGTLEGTRGAYRLANPYGAVRIPSTVQSLLAARIDRLGERDKHVLETAAVIGKEFSERLLRACTGLADGELEAALAALDEASFIDQIQVYPQPEYAFHHPITQEVAYRAQLADRRSAVHRRVATALEEECTGKSDENAALLAHHWDGAGELLPAVTWSRRAAEWAATRDLSEARRHWRKVRDLLDGCADCPQSLGLAIASREALIEVGWKLGSTLDEARALFDEGRALAERAGDRLALARLEAALAMAELFAGEVERGLEDLEHAAMTAADTDDATFEMQMHMRLAYINLLAGRIAESLRHSDSVSAALGSAAEAHVSDGLTARSDTAATSLVAYRGFRALPLIYQGELEAASALLRDSILALSGVDEDRPNRCTMHGFMVTLAWFVGDADLAVNHARQQLALAEQLGTPTLLSGALDSMGVAFVMTGHNADALEMAERALTVARDTGTLLQSEAVFMTNLAAAHLGAGDAETATGRAREAVQVAMRRATPLFECRARLVLARALLASDPPSADEAEQALTAALGIVERTGARGYEPFLRVELARAAALRGDVTASRRERADAARLFRKHGASAYADRIRIADEQAAAV